MTGRARHAERKYFSPFEVPTTPLPASAPREVHFAPENSTSEKLRAPHREEHPSVVAEFHGDVELHPTRTLLSGFRVAPPPPPPPPQGVVYPVSF